MNWDLLATYVARAVALLTAIPVHESAHAWASDKLGDPTAKRYGRLSLNPLRHFDFLGALCMIFVGFGWAKPVPIAAANEFPASPQGYGALRCRRPGIESAAGLFVYDLLQAGVLPRTRHAGLDIRIRGAVPDGVDEYHAGRV